MPTHFAGGSVTPSASIGLLLGDDSHDDAAEALRDADIAMYRAKGDGRNRRVMFEEQMRIRESQRSRLTSALRGTVASGGISLAAAVRMRLAMAAWPFASAITAAVRPSSVARVGSAPRRRSMSTTASSPFRAAACSGVQPPLCTAFGDAPSARRRPAVSRCFPEMAL